MQFCDYVLTLSLIATVTTPVHAFCFDEAGERYGVSPFALWAITKAESDFNPGAVNYNKNGSIDVGLMQINSIHAKQLGKTWDHLFDPCTNVMTGAWVLRQCIDQYGNTWEGIGCYNSRTPSIRNAYAARIAKIIQQAQGLGVQKNTQKPAIPPQEIMNQLVAGSLL